MKTKLLTSLTLCAAIAACAPDAPKETTHEEQKSAPQVVKAAVEEAKEEYNGLIIQEKIQTINLNKLGANIALEEADEYESENETFSAVLENLDDFSSNMVIQSALNHYVLDGNAFSDSLALNLLFDNAAEKSPLTPVVTPNVMMSADYSSIHISLHTATAHQGINGEKKQYKSKYTTQKLIPTKINAEENKQYWVDNPLELKEKIVNGLYEVSQQFTDDFNTAANR